MSSLSNFNICFIHAKNYRINPNIMFKTNVNIKTCLKKKAETKRIRYNRSMYQDSYSHIDDPVTILQ